MKCDLRLPPSALTDSDKESALIQPTSPRVVVLTALPLEYEAVRVHLTNLESAEHEAGTRIEEGSLPGTPWRVAIAEIGEGNTNAAALTERINSWLQPAALLFVGVAGGLKDDVELGDVVVATKIYAYQSGKQDPAQFLSRPNTWEASHRLEQAARHALRSDEWTSHIRSQRPPRPPAVHLKPIASGDVVLNSADSALSAQLHHAYNDAVAIEMESAGFARAAHLADQLQALTIRGISDKADGLKHTADAGGSQPQAAAHAAAAAITVITALAPSASASASNAYPAASSAEVGTARTPHNGGRQPTADGSSPQWEPMSDTVEVSWRRTGHNSPFSTSAASLEIHLVPIPSGSRIEVRKLAQLGDQLIRTGREDGFFTLSELLDTAADDQHTLVTTPDSGQGTTGLAVLRTGQRSAWQPLPHDDMGAVLDPVELPQQIARLLALLVRLPLPDPLSVALGIGIDPATMVSEDTMSRLPRSTAQFPMRHHLLGVHPDESLTMKELNAKSDSVAEELAARLLASFRTPRRSF
ncbi:5'-methylthioadenosine/S-adenosylhomocysteine nucleosidase [Streptomyces sp. NPDC026659]|uniref:5'-methylthioadenosine/S-adenosylhomocysteine nucleosidase family protein n=1 Tax=Streptomyces sp. NPDC026659 TaxID=3155123 RepID=UPI0033EB0C4C